MSLHNKKSPESGSESRCFKGAAGIRERPSKGGGKIKKLKRYTKSHSPTKDNTVIKR